MQLSNYLCERCIANHLTLPCAKEVMKIKRRGSLSRTFLRRSLNIENFMNVVMLAIAMV